MLPAENLKALNTSHSVADDRDDSGVPLSERGKGESMPMDKRYPIVVYGIVVLTYFLILIAVILGMMAFMGS